MFKAKDSNINKGKGYTRNAWGSIILNEGRKNEFRITKKQQEEYKTLVKRANSKRDYYTNTLASQINSTKLGGVYQKERIEQLLQEDLVVYKKQSTSFHQFKNEQDFKHKMKQLKMYNKQGYFDKKVKSYRDSIERMLKNGLNMNGNHEIRQIVKDMTDIQLLTMYMFDPDFVEMVYGYDLTSEEREQVSEKIKNRIDRAIGLENITRKKPMTKSKGKKKKKQKRK